MNTTTNNNTVKFILPNNRGQYGTYSDIYADGTQAHYGDGRDGEVRYAPENLGRSPRVGQSVTFRSHGDGRVIIGTITLVHRLTTGAIEVEIAI